jgi:extracellular factor (EF) 3-hydroxypalmitic acid methyl ester biosynthesis protein
MREAADGNVEKRFFHIAHREVAGPVRSTAAVRLDASIDQLNQLMTQLETETQEADANMDQLAERLTQQIKATEAVARDIEAEYRDNLPALRRLQAEFRKATDRYFSTSYFMHRARVWPRGYPGDYRIIDQAYDNQPLSTGVGNLLDRYFLSSTLADAIRWRRLKMREIIAQEIRRRTNAQVLNIGCGPCREVRELGDTIAAVNAHFLCLDFDDEALAYSADRVAHTAVAPHVEFRQYNALKMINAQRNLEEFGPQDAIYTIGLLDYLTDPVLIRLIRALYETLKPGGVFVAVFKDCERYDTQDYHWLVDWSGFYQRTAEESRRLVEEAGVSSEQVSVERSRCGVMVFYRILRSATSLPKIPAPHRRKGKRSSTRHNMSPKQ